MNYLIISPFGLFLFFRVFLPSLWCFEFLITNDTEHKYYMIVLLHLIYLFFEGLLLIYLMIYTLNNTKKYRIYRNNQIYLYKKNKVGNKYAIIGAFGIFIFLVLNYDSLPIFMKGGSDAIVALSEDKKIRTWLMYGLLEIFDYILLFSIVYIQSTKKKYLYGFLLIFAMLIPGKKSALIKFFSTFTFIYFLINYKKPSFPIGKILIGLSLSSIFIIIQFYRTIGIDINFSNVIQTLNIILNIIYTSSTVYLNQIIQQGGIEYIQMYSNSLGDFGPIIYILNPFLKFLFGIGIYKAPGPFLGEVLYGYTFPNGVNPTLFFESMFVFGDYIAILFSFLNLIVVFVFAKFLIKKIIKDFDKSLLLTISYFGLLMSSLSFLIDTLNTIRDLPFVLLPMFLFYLNKFFGGKYARVNT